VPAILLPDAGPLITLAYADALDLLLGAKWPVHIVDMVLHELTRNNTPTSDAIARWVASHALPVVPTQTFSVYQKNLEGATPPPRKSGLGELAIQEVMHARALSNTSVTGVFLFEDHRIASASFLLPDNCRKVSTRAFLTFLEETGAIDSAAAIERRAIQNGRHFSALRFPPG
jgi:hypothetical protein